MLGWGKGQEKHLAYICDAREGSRKERRTTGLVGRDGAGVLVASPSVYLDFGVRAARLGLGLVVGGSASTHLDACPGEQLLLFQLIVSGCWKVMVNPSGPTIPSHGLLHTQVGATPSVLLGWGAAKQPGKIKMQERSLLQT